jgi:hypothetical protein
VSRYETLQIILTAFLVTGVIVTACIYGCQLSEMQKSTEATTKAAKAAEDSVILARENTHLDQRAWVAEAGISGKPELNNPYKITVIFKNTGKTFAKRYAGTSAFRAKQMSDPDPDFEKILREGHDASAIGLIPPNGTRTQVIEITNGAKITQEKLDELKPPTVVMLVFGKLTYWDIFNCEHWTTYCYRAYTDGTFETYGPYNDADENECL